MLTLDTVLNIYIKTMTEDEDKEVVAQACMSVAEIIKESSYVAIASCKIPNLCIIVILS